MTELTGKLGPKTFFQQTAGPAASAKPYFTPAPRHLLVHPAGAFNWDLSPQECPSCTSVIPFPLFWHLKATSINPHHLRQRQVAHLCSPWRGGKSAATPALHRRGAATT